MTGQHRPPPRPPMLAAHHRKISITCGGVLALSLTFAVATSVAPHAHAPVTVAAPTAVDLREPTGHGGPIGPLAGPLATPSIGADGAWQPKYGPVIVNGQALATPTVALAEPEPEPIPEPSPTPTPVPAPPVAPATTTEPTPVVVVPDVTDPDVTEPVETPPTEPPAEPSVPVVEVTP